MLKFNLCIVEGKCHYKVWAFHSSFILTIAEACLDLMNTLTKVPFPVILSALNGLSLIIISSAGGGKWPDKSFPAFYHMRLQWISSDTWLCAFLSLYAYKGLI